MSYPRATYARVLLFCFLLLACGCASFKVRVAKDESPDGPRRVLLVPLGEFTDPSLSEMASHLEEKFGLRAEVLPAVAPGPEESDAARGQLIAEQLIALVKRGHPEAAGDRQAVLVGVTPSDMYIRGSRGSFAFSCRSPDHVAVVSFARMGLGAESEAAAAELLKVRLRKMITKDVAILSLGMDENYNPRSVLFHAINGLEDLDYAEENLSPFPAMLVSAGPEAEADGGLRFGLTREQRGWALAASALPTEMNGERHDLLGGVHLSPENILSAQRSLQDGWGVDSRGRLLEALEWLETEGHRKEFKRQGAYLSSLTRAQLKVLLDERAGDAEARARIAVVAEHYKRLGGAGLLGWDYSRYVSLCRSGYAAGYITEEEAWAKIIPAARALQTRFGSWKEVGENYLIGREFWAGGGAGQQCGRCREALRRLLADPQSPWRVYPFKTAPHEGGPS